MAGTFVGLGQMIVKLYRPEHRTNALSRRIALMPAPEAKSSEANRRVLLTSN